MFIHKLLHFKINYFIIYYFILLFYLLFIIYYFMILLNAVTFACIMLFDSITAFFVCYQLTIMIGVA